MKKNLYIGFCGIIIGITNIIPGVSGGTMAVVLGIFDEMISAISGIKKHFKKSILFLIPLLIGAGVGIFAFAKLMSFLLDNYLMPTSFFFLGVLVGSLPFLYKRSTIDRFKPLNLVPFFITLALMIAMFVLDPASLGAQPIKTGSLLQFIIMALCGVMAAGAMVVPGISGSFLMLLVGQYDVIIEALSNLNIPLLLAFAVGAVAGIFLVAKLIEYLLKKHPQATYFGILGLVLGSVPSLWPGFAFDVLGIVSIVTFAAGFAASYFFSREKPKEGKAAE